jgi:uncharacterized protein YcbX
MTKVGRIAGLYRYPVKSMAGEPMQTIALGWHGLQGDRRLAFLRRGLPGGGFPWLTASKLPALVTYRPERREGEGSDVLPSLVRTPQGRVLELRGDELRLELSRAHGAEVELVQIDNGIFDDATVSLIGENTIDTICSASEKALDVRRFRPNILIEAGAAFSEEEWIGKTIRFGDAPEAPAVVVSMHDVRCVMINLDPDTAVAESGLLKAAVRLNQNRAGVYATVVRTGNLSVGDELFIE